MVAGDDGVFHTAPAEIEGESVILRCDEVTEPTMVRYGWQPFTRANLVNGAQLPCSTFEMKIPQ